MSLLYSCTKLPILIYRTLQTGSLVKCDQPGLRAKQKQSKRVLLIQVTKDREERRKASKVWRAVESLIKPDYANDANSVFSR
jgi:hypothetical protein